MTSAVERRPLSIGPTVFYSLVVLASALYPLYACAAGVTALQIVLAGAWFVATSLAITVGYHRLVTHRSFRCHPVVELALLVVGAAAFQGSAIRWAADHLQHHAHVDEELDPHSPRHGFWYAQWGWFFRRRAPRRAPPRHLLDHPVARWQDRWFLPLGLAVGVVVPYLIAGVGGALLAGPVRTLVLIHTTGLVNSLAHMGTRRTWQPDASASDSVFVAVVAFGEGWHSYHHRFPRDYRLGARWWQWDPGKWLVWSIAWVGLADELRRADAAPRPELA